MTKSIVTTLGLLLTLAAATPALAQTPDTQHPCKAVEQACEAAGFQRGMHKKDGKGLFLDCMRPLKEGKTVAGVNISADVVNACKAKAAAKGK